MPSLSREGQVDLSVTPYYHCISRCVRRAFLCGEDRYSGQNYDHRKNWFIERLRTASEVFTIDICAYAVMSNHFHVVLRIDTDRAGSLSDEALLRRYAKLFPFVTKKVRALPKSAKKKQLDVLRQRLTDISWFMRVINEYVARRANKEDNCTGRFWEGRFKSQALLDETALYTCMSYVDLNPVRAGIADTLAGSEFTSIQQRLHEHEAKSAQENKNSRATRDKSRTTRQLETTRQSKRIALAPLRKKRTRHKGRRGHRASLGMHFDDYRELLEWTGRTNRTKPSGKLSGTPALLAELRIDPTAWLSTMGNRLPGGTCFGNEASMNTEAKRRGKKWLRGKSLAKSLFRSRAA